MKFYQRIFFIIFLLLNSSTAFSDIQSDANKVFNLLEGLFPELLAPTQTQIVDGICLRHYPETEIYTAVICEDKGIFPFENLFVLISSQLHDFGNINQYRDLFENQSDSDGSINTATTSPGNGNCVNVPFPKAGLRASYTSSSFSSPGVAVGTFSSDMTFHSVDSTSAVSTTEVFFEGEKIQTLESTVNYQIIDNFRYNNSEIAITSSVIPLSENLVEGRQTRTYSPGLIVDPALVYCEQQSWSSESTVSVEDSAAFPGGNSTQIIEDSRSGVVESVNETITTAAGSFNTTRVRYLHGLDTLTWISIEHGIHIKIQTIDHLGNVLFSSEITSIN